MDALVAEVFLAAWGWGGYWWWWWWWIVLVFFLWAIFLPPFGWGRRWYGGYRSRVGVPNSLVAGEWQSVEAQFVDSPANAVTQADQLVTNAAAQSGARLSASTQYQEAHAIAIKAQSGQADDRELRRAMMLYRNLLEQIASSAIV